jgi:putative salt-induced outer membrane protein YdiY
MRVRSAALLFGLAISQGALADRVEFTNGDAITGTVTSIAGGKVVVQTEYAGKVTAALDKVAKIRTDAEMNLLTTDGEKLFSALDGEAAGVKLSNLNRDLALADVDKATRSVAGAAVEVTRWRHKVDVAAALTKGNTDTRNFSVFTESIARNVKNEHLFTAGLFQDEVDSATTRELFDIKYGYKRFLANPKWFFGANAEYFKDKLLGIDPRITAGAGLGYRFWDDSLGSLTVELGGSAVYEDLVTNGSQTNPAVRWALDYRRLLFGEQLEFFHRHQILKILDSSRGEVLDSSTGLAFLFDEWWSASVRADVRHQTEPPLGSHRTDIAYAIGVGVRF